LLPAGASGIVSAVKPEVSNARDLISTNEEGILIDSSEEHSLNAPPPIVVTESGSVIVVNDSQPKQNLSGIAVILAGRVSDVSDVHLARTSTKESTAKALLSL